MKILNGISMKIPNGISTEIPTEISMKVPSGISMKIASEISMEKLWNIYENFGLNRNGNSMELTWKLRF